MKAVRIHQPGGPEVLTYEDVPSPELKPGHALIDVQVAGVNFADIYSRSGVGSYGAWSPSRAHAAGLPMILGREACGVVSAIGEGITHFKVGDLVAYRGIPGSYAEQAVVPERLLAKVPDGIDPKLGAAAMSQGVTAHYLAFSTYPLKPGDTCLVHAGAGGVGLMLIQMAKMAGAYVYTTVSTGEKAEVAKGAGADEVILYTQVDFEEEIKKATNGRGVDAVYDAVGKTTFEQSCRSVARRGCMVLYGSTQRLSGERGHRCAEEWLYVLHLAQPRRLCGRTGGARLAVGRGLRLGQVRRAQGAHRRDLPVVRRGGGSPPARGALVHGQAPPHPLGCRRNPLVMTLRSGPGCLVFTQEE